MSTALFSENGNARVLATVCNQPMDQGSSCQRAVPSSRFHYNPTSRSCQQFIYYGCDGNGNNFKTAQECQFYCSSLQPSTNNRVNIKNLLVVHHWRCCRTVLPRQLFSSLPTWITDSSTMSTGVHQLSSWVRLPTEPLRDDILLHNLQTNLLPRQFSAILCPWDTGASQMCWSNCMPIRVHLPKRVIRHFALLFNRNPWNNLPQRFQSSLPPHHWSPYTVFSWHQ